VLWELKWLDEEDSDSEIYQSDKDMDTLDDAVVNDDDDEEEEEEISAITQSVTFRCIRCTKEP